MTLPKDKREKTHSLSDSIETMLGRPHGSETAKNSEGGGDPTNVGKMGKPTDQNHWAVSGGVGPSGPLCPIPVPIANHIHRTDQPFRIRNDLML